MTDPESVVNIAGLNPPDALREALERALGAQYTVVGLLGRGGMGAVYLARERLLDRLVAIKVLPAERSDDGSRERFLREARTAAQLSHPNVVPLLSFGDLGDTLFYIMRYVDGESLEHRVQRDGKLSVPEVRRILAEVADALTEAHRLGIVHRDIKPDNVMIERGTGRAMLTDFGIARQLGSGRSLTGTGLILGSPQYMSPEQASGDRDVDARSDLYSLGVLGYRMLTGRLPFEGESVRELLVQQVMQQPTAIASHIPDAPLDLTDALMRCLEKEPERRWNSAESFRFAIAVRTGDAFEVPEQLEGLPRIGTRALMSSYTVSVGLVSLYAYTNDRTWLNFAIGGSILALVAPVVPFGLRRRRFGMSWGQVLRMAFWPPSGLLFRWWPKPLRPPGDLFERLPQSVRRVRMWTTATFSFVGLVSVPLVLASFVAGLAHVDLMRQLFQLGMFSCILAMLSLLPMTIGANRWRKRWSLTPLEVEKLAYEPTHGSRFWERPSIAALLRGDDAPASESATTVEGMLQSLNELASKLPDGATSIAREAADAARDLARELRALDERIGEMAKQSDPAEQNRLKQRLAALGPEREGQPDGAREMRALLQGQVDLFAKFDASRRELELRRDTMLELLRTLWLQMMNYRAQVARAGDATELSGSIRELCHSIERRASATAEADQLLHRSTPGR